jgi:hypothetical protein
MLRRYQNILGISTEVKATSTETPVLNLLNDEKQKRVAEILKELEQLRMELAEVLGLPVQENY